MDASRASFLIPYPVFMVESSRIYAYEIDYITSFRTAILTAFDLYVKPNFL